MRYDFISALTTLINEKNWQLLHSFVILYTGKSFSEPRILASTNPQYDKRLFIEFTSSVHENYKLRTSGEHVVYTSFFVFVFVFVLRFRTIYVHNMFS